VLWTTMMAENGVLEAAFAGARLLGRALEK
jgi:hypothetical protein